MDLPPPEVRRHESGLRTQRVTGPRVRMIQSHTVPLPPMCPVSGNPRSGSSLQLRYLSVEWCLEVYSLRHLLERFRGGWRGTDRYPAERNMEGAIALIAQMAADALEVPVRYRAELLLDVDPMLLRGKAKP